MGNNRRTNNKAIRIAMIDADIHLYELAQLLGIHEVTLSRWMRNELPEVKQEEIISVIHEYMEDDLK